MRQATKILQSQKIKNEKMLAAINTIVKIIQ